MRSILMFALSALVGLSSTASAESVESAAKRFEAGTAWQAGSVVEGDFDCDGKVEPALLGTSQSEILVAVFVRGLSSKPDVLRFSASARDPKTVALEIEDLDFKPEELEQEVGFLPSGLRPSKTCVGLSLSDQKVDAAHIYWNWDAKRFESWSR